MLKKFKCSDCGRVVLGFEEDIIRGSLACIEELISSRTSQHPLQQCCFVAVPSLGQPPVPTIHGEAGFFTEGTSFDSTDTIHDYTKLETDKAEDTRELNAYLVARRDS